jgi:transcriptional regulator with PAS, ATPase and Fis domain
MIIDNIVGSSLKIKELIDLAVRVASTDATVLITGESGTGKDLFAEYIHENSSRAHEKFISVNCSAIPENLLENELFGHKKGAFTDAKEDFIGKFGIADKGTFFLDEIGDMKPVLQAKVLRAIQFKEYEPVGSTSSIKSDVRFIAATNKNLPLMIKEGKFREDLYYRLNVVPFNIPPLRDRKEDIDGLIDFFVGKFNKKNNKNIKGFTKESIEYLKSYNWPGNIRELENIIERSVVLLKNDLVEINDINLNINPQAGQTKNNIKSFKDAINEFKREFIIKSLDNYSWNQTKTAKNLGIQRTYLAKLIKTLKIEKI